MFEKLEEISRRPEPFEHYTAAELWTNEHTSKQMLSFHLNGDIDVSSRKTAFIDRSVEWLASRFDIDKGIKIADFGCGPGLYAFRLTMKRAEVTGIDFSPRSIEYARDAAAKAGLSICYVNKDYLTFDTGERFDLILMLMCDFCALNPAQRKTMLTKFNNLLKDGGAVLLDVYSLGMFEQREETTTYGVNLLNGFWSPQKYYGFLNTFRYEEEKVVLDKYTIVESGSSRTVYSWMQCFNLESLEREFTACGLKAEEFYSDVAGTPFDAASTEFAVIARKA